MPCRCAGSGNEANPFNTGSQARYAHRRADQNCDCPHPGYRTKEPTGGHRAEERTSVLGIAPEAGIVSRNPLNALPCLCYRLLGVAHATYEMECTDDDDARLRAARLLEGYPIIEEGRAALGPANEVRSERWGFPYGLS
jgi:hypothetical protein